MEQSYKTKKGKKKRQEQQHETLSITAYDNYQFKNSNNRKKNCIIVRIHIHSKVQTSLTFYYFIFIILYYQNQLFLYVNMMSWFDSGEPSTRSLFRFGLVFKAQELFEYEMYVAQKVKAHYSLRRPKSKRTTGTHNKCRMPNSTQTHNSPNNS